MGSIEPVAPGTPPPGGTVGGFMEGVSNIGSGIGGFFAETEDEKRRKALLQEQGAKAGGFADMSQGGFLTGGVDASNARKNLARMASGELSYSREALRQGMQQQMAGQRSMAASASPMNAGMAARTAANNMGRAQYGMSGQAALAGIQEQQGASKLLQDAILQQRQQDLQAALGSRQNAMTGYGANGQPEKSNIEKYGPSIVGGLAAFSDRRLKKNVNDADDAAASTLKSLKAYSYDYKDEKHGKGRQLGVMAQDLKKAGLGQAVIDTPDGLMVHGAKLAGANTAMLAALAKRVGKLEGE